MNERFVAPAFLCLFAAGCATPEPVVEDEGPRPASSIDDSESLSEPVAVPPQYPLGCEALADTEPLRGTIRVIDFGKGTDGVIIDDGEIKWVVSYDATKFFDEFEDDEVFARGRRCEKRGAAVKAYHFDALSIRVIE